MKSNKKLIIIMSIIIALVIASVVFAYLFFMTDIFKSKEELFAKYLTQNAETFQKITDLNTVQVYENLENESKYQSNTNIKMIYSEGGEVSNPMNNLSVKLDLQKDDNEQYVYGDGKILYEDEEYLEAEIIKSQELYGIRFTDVAKQFITLKNDENIESVLSDLGIDTTQMENLVNIIDETEQSANIEQLYTLKDKYLNIITTAISNGTFKKQKNAMITYNDVTTETNAYSVDLSSEQVENMLIEILNNLKGETEILDQLEIDKEEYTKQIDETINWITNELEVPAVKVTVYEQKQQTIRTVVEVGVHKITIESIEQDGEIKTRISYLNNDDATQYDLELSKTNLDNQEKFEATINALEGEASYKITLLSQMQILDNQIEFNAKITHEQDITTVALTLENKVSIGTDFEEKQTLDSSNNLTLNNLEQPKRQQVIAFLQQQVPQKTFERISLLMQKLMLNNSENEQSENQMSQVEINKFNSKFEFYTGDEVSVENVKMLLDIVKNHLASYEITEVEQQQNTGSVLTGNEKISIKLNIGKDVLNEDGINQVLEKIEDNKKYKVMIFYKQANGLIDYVTITEI